MEAMPYVRLYVTFYEQSEKVYRAKRESIPSEARLAFCKNYLQADHRLAPEASYSNRAITKLSNT